MWREIVWREKIEGIKALGMHDKASEDSSRDTHFK